MTSSVPRRQLCVYCGSKPGHHPSYAQAAHLLAVAMKRQHLDLVYGAGGIGIMGEIANAVLASGGSVTGIIPTFLDSLEQTHPQLTHLFVVENMHERKAKMAELSDAFLTLPGGLGTMEELFETWTWGQLKLHTKPIGLLNVNGYFDPLIAFLDHGVEQGFIYQEHRELLVVSDKIDSLIDMLVERMHPSTVDMEKS
jgi:uncharacterized protein (TIGR00730 family)